MKPQIAITNYYKDGEEKFILNAWIKVALNSNTHSRVRRSVFFNEFPKLAEECLRKANVLVARSLEDENQLFGCIVYTDDCILFCYIKSIYRGFGLFTEMLDMIEKKPKSYCIQNTYTKILNKKGLEYNPYEQYKI